MRIIKIIIVILFIAALTALIVLSIPKTEPDKPIDTEYYYKAGSDFIDKRYTPPNTYEGLCRKTFENGLSVDRWVEITKEDYDELCKEDQEQK